MEAKLTEKAISSPVVDRTNRRANDVTIVEILVDSRVARRRWSSALVSLLSVFEQCVEFALAESNIEKSTGIWWCIYLL
jgi:hypothetical protein